MTFKELLFGEKKCRVLLLFGLAGILLLGISSLFPAKKSEKAAASEPTAAQIEQAYCERAQSVLEQIDGVGDSRVTVTLASGEEHLYVKEETHDGETQTDEGASVSERRSESQKVIFVEDANGRKQALLRKTLSPTVRGVVVTCTGGGNARVVAEVTEAMQVLFGIRSTQVCVTAMRRE